mgnify:CR=1 FL=1
MTNLNAGSPVILTPQHTDLESGAVMPGIHDWRSHLNITAGLHVISGNEALAFVRDRHAIGNGGDLGRIRMQQMFISSLIKKVMSAGTLSDALCRVVPCARFAYSPRSSPIGARVERSSSSTGPRGSPRARRTGRS